MDVISGYQARASARLDELATLMGFPGKLGMDGSKVWDCYRSGDLQSIRNYCETDALNTYLLYLRFELIRGRLTPSGYEAECDRVREELARADQPHLAQFLQAWSTPTLV